MQVTRRQALLVAGLVAAGAVASAAYFGPGFGNTSEIKIKINNHDSVSHEVAIIISDSDGNADYFTGLAEVQANSKHVFSSGITIGEFVPEDIFANIIIDSGVSNRFSLDIKGASSVTFVIGQDGQLSVNIM